MREANKKRHRTGRIGWLRAAVLGANDGILSTSSLVLGVAAAHAAHSNILLAGVAGLVAGAMTTGENITNSWQSTSVAGSILRSPNTSPGS
jgi:VIT1/CCC1 family predicted Fe2+/Mn2+ transporter